MAKKGGVQLLQADINTDDEFEKLLEKSGLLVMDVYTEWCGPCLGMVGSLKKIKLELGGDNLQLAICKSDGIEGLKRFRNRSEPTWLFASHGKAVNIMFGTNVPKLMKLIISELELELMYREGRAERVFYEITELLPLEEERINKKKKVEEEAARIEREAAERKRREYILHVTDEIMKHLPDAGVTLFGPHISREIFKKLIDPADMAHISCKDRKVIQLQPQMLEILFFEIENPLEEDVLEQIYNKEMLMCLWKVAENETRPIEELLQIFVEALVRPQQIVDEYGAANPDLSLPPIMQSMEVEIDKSKKIPPTFRDSKSTRSSISGRLIPPTEDVKSDKTSSGSVQPEGNEENKETEEIKRVVIPAVWTPKNKRANAAAIYLFFRQQTELFLPPDPVPEPPHLAMAFDAYKRKDILEVCDQYKQDILSYGYFSSADPDATQLLVNSSKKYELIQPNVTDKLVLKVAKVTSHAVLALAAQGPCYVSLNTVNGESECKKFFPEGYKTGEEEEEELLRQTMEAAAKKKKKRKKKTDETSEGVGTVVSENDIEDPAVDGEIDDDDEGEEGKEEEQNE